MRDDVGKTDRRGEALVPVDPVAVERRPGVLDQPRPVDVDRLARHLVTDGDVGRPTHGRGCGGLAHHSPPRMTMVDVAVQTGSPASVASSVRVVTIA